jgi:PilZ domain
MLDLGNEQNLSTVSWDTVEMTARLPSEMPNFFEQEGPLPVRPDCRRAYPRFYLRGKAILRLDSRLFGVYTVDASRRGIRFISPIQLLPKLRVWLRLPKIKEFQVEIVRCRRFEECCYDSAGVFVLENADAVAKKRLP